MLAWVKTVGRGDFKILGAEQMLDIPAPVLTFAEQIALEKAKRAI